jgi:DNA-binding response OmpR family regulator
MTPELPHLLLAEDDRVLASLLVEVLSDAYLVTQVPDGQAALHAALTRSFDVMVIDRGLPAIEGADLVKRLRSRGLVTPILLLTARGTTADRVEGLDAGAEDYLVKPFEIDELLARLRALLRRHRDQADVLEIGARRLEASSRRVVGGGRAAVELSPRETRLLEILARHPNRVFTRQELLEAVFDSNDGSGAVDTYVYYLRQKLGRTAIRTVHGLGYQLGAP